MSEVSECEKYCIKQPSQEILGNVITGLSFCPVYAQIDFRAHGLIPPNSRAGEEEIREYKKLCEEKDVAAFIAQSWSKYSAKAEIASFREDSNVRDLAEAAFGRKIPAFINFKISSWYGDSREYTKFKEEIFPVLKREGYQVESLEIWVRSRRVGAHETRGDEMAEGLTYSDYSGKGKNPVLLKVPLQWGRRLDDDEKRQELIDWFVSLGGEEYSKRD